MAVRLTYHGSPNASSILQEGFRPGRMLSVAPGQVFSTPNVNFASGYGNPVKMATSTNAFSLPSVNLSSGQIGREVIQSPQNATRGMQLAQMAERLKNVSPTAARLLEGKTIRGIGGSSIGRSILGRTLGTILGGTVVSTGGILASPYIAMANQLYGPNVQKAQDFAGMYGEAMPEDMYEEYSSYLGKQGIPQALSDTVMAEPQKGFEDYPGVENLGGVQNFDLEGVRDIISQMEEEKGNYIERPEDRFNMDGILQNLGGYAKDAAGRYIGSQALGGAGAMLFGPIGGLIGGIAGLLGGGGLFNQNTYSQQMYNNLTAAGKQYADQLYGPGGVLQGYNQFSGFGRGTLGTIANNLAKNPNMSPARRNAYRTAADKYISGIDPTQQGYNAVTKKGGYGYDDAYINYAPPSGGGDSGGGGGSRWETYGSLEVMKTQATT
jgi:hypothetical protein